MNSSAVVTAACRIWWGAFDAEAPAAMGLVWFDSMMVDSLAPARAALSQQRWRDAFDAFAAMEPVDEFGVDDLEGYALAAQLIGEDDVAAATWEQAHLRLLSAGDVPRAVRCAFWLAFGLLNAGRMSQAGGWFARAQRLLDNYGDDCVEQGFLLVPRGLRTLEGGDPQGALVVFRDMLEIGDRYADLDLVALARMAQGRALVVLGRDVEGLALLDEAMVSVTAREVSPLVAGRIYCAVILVCQQAFDVDRAQEWTAALSQWCDAQQGIVPFRGQCLIHRSEYEQWRGNWSGAMLEAERARDHLSRPDAQPAIGMAFYQLGELLRLRGEFADAEAAYQEASRHGKAPQPGLAWLRLMQGELDAAEATIRRALHDVADRATRAKVLSAAVDILLAANDDQAARDAASELEAIAESVGAPVLRAMASQAKALIALHRNDARSAIDAAQSAAAAWARLDAPYEHARARSIVALACREIGDSDGERFWAEPAQEAFQRLGAIPDSERLKHALDDGDGSLEQQLTERQVEVLSRVAAGLTNRQIAEELFVSEHTVRRHLQNIFTKTGVTTRAAATAYAYENGLL